jgi:cytochrome P450 family 6
MVTKEYTLPNGATLPEGTGLIIPVLGIHRDPLIYSNPLKFDPERFSEVNKSSRHPFSWIPFGEGKLNKYLENSLN